MIQGIACLEQTSGTSPPGLRPHRRPSVFLAYILSILVMPPKRLRRASPAQSGLNAGERLKRTKLTDSRVYSAWGWVGTEVTDVSQITQQHRLATCGFSKNSLQKICPNRFAVSKASSPVKGSLNSEVAEAEADDDVIVISDDESPQCNARTCKSNPYCLNYLGQEKWEDEGECIA